MWVAIRTWFAQLGDISVPYALSALAVWAFSTLLVSLRWQLILTGLGCPVPLRETFLANLSGYFIGSVTPGRAGGEVIRVVLIRQRAGVDAPTVIVSLGYDRLADVIPLLLMGLLSVPVIRQLAGSVAPRQGAVVAALLGVALLAMGLWALMRGDRMAAWLASWRTRFVRIRVRTAYAVWALAISFLVWSLDVVRLFLCALALGVNLGPWRAIVLSAVAPVAGVLPTVGGLGAVEGSLTAILYLYGVGINKALTIALLERSISFGVSTLLGATVLFSIGGRRLFRLARGRRLT